MSMNVSLYTFKSHWASKVTSSIVNMMTSCDVNIFRVTVPLCGEFTGHRWISLARKVTPSFGVFFDLRMNKRLSK